MDDRCRGARNRRPNSLYAQYERGNRGIGKVMYITEKRLYPIIKRSFPNMVVAAQGATYDWTRNSVKKMVISLWVVFQEGIEKLLILFKK